MPLETYCNSRDDWPQSADHVSCCCCCCSSRVIPRASTTLFAPQIDKCVSFEKSVSFSDEPIEFLPGGKHSPQPTGNSSEPQCHSLQIPYIVTGRQHIDRLLSYSATFRFVSASNSPGRTRVNAQFHSSDRLNRGQHFEMKRNGVPLAQTPCT
jgi:hypothetical protein